MSFYTSSEVSVSQCSKVGACILFTVMDHDFMMTNDFAGEAYLSLNNIPGISGEDISGFSALTPNTLILTQPRRGKGNILYYQVDSYYYDHK